MIYPAFFWGITRENKVPDRFWDSKEHQYEFFEKIARGSNITIQMDWFHVTSNSLVKSGGNFINSKYNCDMTNALATIYPEFYWDASRRLKVPQHFWDSKEIQRNFLDRLGNNFHVYYYSDWYEIKVRRLFDVIGSAITTKFQHSILNMLLVVYPEFSWNPFLQNNVMRNFWKIRENQEKFIEMCRNCFNINNNEDWYRLSLHQIAVVAKRTMSRAFFLRMLHNTFPNQDWRPELFKRRKNHGSGGC